MARRRWWQQRDIGPHASPDIERQSARIVGQLDEVCDQLAELVAEVTEATGELDMEQVRRAADREREA